MPWTDPLSGSTIAGAKARLGAARSPMMLARDIVDRLRSTEGSGPALLRLRRETEIFDELEQQISVADERLYKLGDLAQLARGDLERLGQGKPPVEGETTADKQRKAVEEELREIADNAEHERGRRADLSARAQPLGQRLERCRRRIRTAAIGEPLRFIPAPQFDRKKFTLAIVHDQVLQLQADYREIEAAPRTAAEVKEMITRWVERMACAPHVGRLFDRGGEGSVYLPGMEIDGRHVPDAFGALLWLGKGEIVKRLHADADLLADEKFALTEAERTAGLSKGKAAILAAERIEEALLWEAMIKGEPVTPRADADVRAILSIE